METTPAVYVFLRQEIDRHQGKDSLVNAVTDGLILWALEGTNPDEGILMSQEEIIAKIKITLPTAIPIISPAITNRLKELSKGPKSSARPIKQNTKQKRFSLSWEFRKRLVDDNIQDESLRIKVKEAFERRLSDLMPLKTSAALVSLAAELSLQVIQKTFESQGIELATFISKHEYEQPRFTIADYYEECAEEFEIKPKQELLVKEAVLENLRNAFYNSSEAERLFFSRLASTYTLLFCLKSEPRIVEYFQRMAGDFYLYIGSDIIIRALTERYLRSEDQITRNTLKLIRAGKGKLVLSEPALDDVFHHLKSADHTFREHYKSTENAMTLDIAKQSQRILIRAYFYAKLSPVDGVGTPRHWEDFISQFCDYQSLRRSEGKEQLRKYLMAEFGMSFEGNDELTQFAGREQVLELADKLSDLKQNRALAENDALLTLAVYGRRRTRKEVSEVSEYGYRTWWLTQESRILRYTAEIQKKNGSEFIMRPEFIVSFFSLAPSMAQVRKTFETVFPTVLGVRLARRVNQHALGEVLDLLKEANDLEPGRRRAKVSELSDRLKTTALRDVLPKIG